MTGELEALIEQVHDRGMVVNNLFEVDDAGSWQANVRLADDSLESGGYEFGSGGSPAEALADALTKAAPPVNNTATPDVFS